MNSSSFSRLTLMIFIVILSLWGLAAIFGAAYLWTVEDPYGIYLKPLIGWFHVSCFMFHFLLSLPLPLPLIAFLGRWRGGGREFINLIIESLSWVFRFHVLWGGHVPDLVSGILRASVG